MEGRLGWRGTSVINSVQGKSHWKGAVFAKTWTRWGEENCRKGKSILGLRKSKRRDHEAEACLTCLNSRTRLVIAVEWVKGREGAERKWVVTSCERWLLWEFWLWMRWKELGGSEGGKPRDLSIESSSDFNPLGVGAGPFARMETKKKPSPNCSGPGERWCTWDHKQGEPWERGF